MPFALTAIVRPTPCCAQIVPTRSSGWHTVFRRLSEWAAEGLRIGSGDRLNHEALPALDAATLRDLGLSHRLAALTPRAERPYGT